MEIDSIDHSTNGETVNHNLERLSESADKATSESEIEADEPEDDTTSNTESENERDETGTSEVSSDDSDDSYRVSRYTSKKNPELTDRTLEKFDQSELSDLI